MPRALINGIKIYYEVEGSAPGPWLTFSNSLRTDHTMWAPQTRAFAGDFRVLRYDVRGHGMSDKSEGFYSVDLLSRDLIGLWDHLGIKKSHLCGLSLGGMMGMHMGMQFADRIDKLVVCDCRGDSPPDLIETWTKRREAVIAKGMESVLDETLTAWFPPAYVEKNRDFVHLIGRTVAETSQEGYFGCSGMLCELTVGKNVGKIKVPTLFVCGSADGPHPALMKAMHEGLPGSQFALLEGGTHVANLTAEKDFNAAVRRFLT